MGFLNQTPAEWFGEATQSADIDTMWVEGLLLERTKARANKNFARSDEIRDELAKGIVIEDSPKVEVEVRLILERLDWIGDQAIARP